MEQFVAYILPLAESFPQYAAATPIAFVLVRTLAIIIPPIPGFAIDLAGLVTFGAWKAFLLAELSFVIGTLGAFFIARKFREPAVARFVSIQKIHYWEKQISERKKFWAIVAIRIITIPVYDFLSYAAGLTKLKTSHFILSSILSHLPYMFVVYFFGGISLQGGASSLTIFVAILLLIGYIITRKSVLQRLRWIVAKKKSV